MNIVLATNKIIDGSFRNGFLKLLACHNQTNSDKKIQYSYGKSEIESLLTPIMGNSEEDICEFLEGFISEKERNIKSITQCDYLHYLPIFDSKDGRRVIIQDTNLGCYRILVYTDINTNFEKAFNLCQVEKIVNCLKSTEYGS